MATKDPNRGAAAPQERSALQWAAILVGLYVAMHLAAGGAIRLLTGRAASEVIASGGSAATSVAARSASSPTGKESSAPASQLKPRSATGRARECKLGPIDSNCNFD
jgi:hypothetical protein